jgi:RHS repeat-associated protein
VIKIVSITGGAADLDTDGDGIADAGTGLGILDVERQQLASLYSAGQSLWRIQMPHFSAADANWSPRPPRDARFALKDPRRRKNLDHTCQASGSVIECQNQILGEEMALIGTPFKLRYQSERTPGYVTAYELEIPLTDDSPPASLQRVEVEISVAGQFHRLTFGPAANQETTFRWDGRNAYGQIVQGEQPVTVRIGYVYANTPYGDASRFGSAGAGALSGSPERNEVTLWRTWYDQIGTFDARAQALGGWTLSAQHAYIPFSQTLYRGDGRRQTTRAIGSTIQTFAGNGQCGLGGEGGPATSAPVCPDGLAFGPDGSLYIASPALNLVRRVAPDGTLSTVAGNTLACSPADEPCGDGGPARQARLSGPSTVAVGSDNGLYIGESGGGRPSVRRVSAEGIITTFAGTRTSGFSGDGGQARLAQLSTITGLAAPADGSVYIADAGNLRIRRVAPDGVIETVAGNGADGSGGDGGPATLAALSDPRGLAVGQDGSLYVADASAHRVRQVTPDGIIRTIAGTGTAGFSGDGGQAIQATLRSPHALAVGPDDTVYIADVDNQRVRFLRPGGTINTLAGGSTLDVESGLARQAVLSDLHFGLAVGPDGGIYASQAANNSRVRKISPILEPFLAGGPGGIAVPSTAGDEVYLFTIAGRHVRTIDALTGALRYQFGYDAAGRLTSITDASNNVTRVERDAAGSATAIVSPFGQRTLLTLNTDGYLFRATSPDGAAAQATYTANGLLTTFTNPRGQTTRYTFDTHGRLSTATDPTGATKTLSYSGTHNQYTVTLSSPLGRSATYHVEHLDNEDVRVTTTTPSGVQSQSLIAKDGTQTATFADGTQLKIVLATDPRWGMQAPIAGTVTLTTPSGKVLTTLSKRSVTLAVASDLLSLRTLTDTRTINGHTTTAAFDAPSRTLRITTPAGRPRNVEFDDRGHAIQEQMGDLLPVRYTYDARGHLAMSTTGARVNTFTYGADGFLAATTDAIGRSVSFVYDAAGRVLEETLPDGQVARFTYDLDGNLIGLTPPGRPQHTFIYTSRDETSAYSPPLIGAEDDTTQFSYNADRQPLRTDRPDGQTVQVQYDAGGRLSLFDLVSGDLTYSYDAAGRLAALNSPGELMAFAYDGRLPIHVTWSGAVAGSVSRTLDGELRPASTSVNGTAPITVAYDADSLPIQVGALALTRSPQTGLIEGLNLGAMTDTVGRDGFGDPIHYAATLGGSAVYAFDLTRDAVGRVNGKAETLGGITHSVAYAYDAAGRLTEVRRDGLLSETYTYDGNGNRLSFTDASGTVNASYDAQDRLTQYGGNTFTYSRNGERVSRSDAGQTTQYRYDSLANLSGVILPDGTRLDYVLDGSFRRVGKRVNGTLVQGFLYQDALRPIAELDGAGSVVSRFVYAGGDVPEYIINGGATFRILTDQLGSPRLVVDVATGAVAQQLDYDTFGNVVLDTHPGFQPFGFAGGLYDAQSRLVHFGAREYDPQLGRWISKDPIRFSGGATNLYAYAGSDPVNGRDMTGLVDSVDAHMPGICAANPVACKEIAAAAGRVAGTTGAAATIEQNAEPIVENLEAGGEALVAGVEDGVGAVEDLMCVRDTAQTTAPALEEVPALASRAPTLEGMGNWRMAGERVPTLVDPVEAPTTYAEARQLAQLERGVENWEAWHNRTENIDAATWAWHTIEAMRENLEKLPWDERSAWIRMIYEAADTVFKK